jgi:hypothetical protein
VRRQRLVRIRQVAPHARGPLPDKHIVPEGAASVYEYTSALQANSQI